MIAISQGEVFFKKYTREIKKQVTAKLLEGVNISPQNAGDIEFPAVNATNSTEKALSLLIDKIVIEGKDYGYNDFNLLEEKELITMADFDIIEAEVNKITAGTEVKKNS